jgi:hypothetical protein
MIYSQRNSETFPPIRGGKMFRYLFRGVSEMFRNCELAMVFLGAETR